MILIQTTLGKFIQKHLGATFLLAAFSAAGVMTPALLLAENQAPQPGALLDAVKKNSKTMVEYGLTSKDITQQEKDDALVAAITGSVKAEIVEALVAGGANPNAKDAQQDTVLIIVVGKTAAASSAGAVVPGFRPLGPVRTKMATALIEKGADPALKNPAGDSALTLLAAKPEPALLDSFLKKVKSRDVTDGAGKTPLMVAAETNNSSNVDVLLKYPGKIDLTDAHGQTALLHAAKKGNIEIARKLIKAGADVNRKDSEGETALILAAKSNQPSMVKFLISSGADANLGSAAGQQALHEARSGTGKPNNEIVENLKPPLTQAVEKNDLVTFEKLLASGAKVDSLNPDGSTALARAVELTRSNMAALLLEHGANPNARSGNGTPVLVLAAETGDYVLVRALLAKGAHPSDTDKSGKSAAAHAEAKGFGNIVSVLKEAEAKK